MSDPPRRNVGFGNVRPAVYDPSEPPAAGLERAPSVGLRVSSGQFGQQFVRDAPSPVRAAAAAMNAELEAQQEAAYAARPEGERAAEAAEIARYDRAEWQRRMAAQDPRAYANEVVTELRKRAREEREGASAAPPIAAADDDDDDGEGDGVEDWGEEDWDAYFEEEEAAPSSAAAAAAAASEPPSGPPPKKKAKKGGRKRTSRKPRGRKNGHTGLRRHTRGRLSRRKVKA